LSLSSPALLPTLSATADGSNPSGVLPALSAMAEGSSPSAPVARSNNAITALIHLYRAEASSMTSARQRLDTTTSWAITSSALVTTFTLGNTQISHAAILFLIFLNFFFLQIEARRFCAYEAGRYRVLLLEHWFYGEMLGESVDPHWTRALIRALRTHYPRVSFAGALGWRLRRNYLWMYLTVLLVWIGKLALSGGPMVNMRTDLAERATVGSIPGTVVWAVITLFYVWLILLAMLAKRLHPIGDEESLERSL
jgi:uncharacterized membrane protein